MLKIIIPIAGSSELFNPAEYFYPKPLIEINGQPMIEVVLGNLKEFIVPHEIIFIIKNEDAKKFYLDNTLHILSPNSTIIQLQNPTKGALCSVLLSIDKIDDDDEILILNGDQLIEEDFNEIYDYWQNKNADAGLVTFKAVHPRWSYVKLNNEMVTETAEKRPISNQAIAGYYYVRKAKNFFQAAFNVILNEAQINDIYFISSTFNELVLRNMKIYTYEISSEKYISFYSPEKIKQYELAIRK